MMQIQRLTRYPGPQTHRKRCIGIFVPLAIVAFVSFAPGLVYGFDVEPEYQGLSETDLVRFESPREQDAEYQSQINSYSLPLGWDRKWYSRDRVLDTSVGSITNQHFAIYSRAKLETDILEDLRFRFTYLAQRDREVDQSRHIFELSERILPWIRFNVYGEPSHYKRENDIGVAILAEPLKEWENRLYYTHHDFTRSEHNDQSDSYVGDDPISVGWTSRIDTGNAYSRAGFRYDKPVGWNIPQQGRFFRFEKTLFFADAAWNLERNRTASTRAQYDSTFKGQNPTVGSNAPIKSWKLNRQQLRLAYGVGSDEEPISYEYSLMYASRLWMNQDGADVMHQNIMPGATARLRSVRRADGFDHIQIGLEATDFRTYGDLALAPSSQKHESLEERLQTAYEFNFRSDSRLLVAFNFDLDEWAGVPTFDGGNMQFRAYF